jgi:DnaK suppressor protein
MPAKKPAKTKKQPTKPVSKPAASKAVAVKKKTAAVSKPKVSAKPAAKPASKPVSKAKPTAKAKQPSKPAKPAKAIVKPVIKPVIKPVAKPAAKPELKAVAKAPVAKPVVVAKAPAKAVVEKAASKAVAKPVVSDKPGAKPVAAPKAAVPVTPSTPIRSAVAVKSSVSVLKPKKDPASANDEDAELNDSLSILAGPRNVKPYQVKRDEEYMNPTQLDHFRTILQSWKKDLMNEVDRTVLHMKDEAANFPDPNDRATQESEFSLELRTRDRERKLIRKIEEALNRIEDGSYGYCTETGEEIGVKRLEARPVATLCVEAQERRERRERQYGDRDDRYR